MNKRRVKKFFRLIGLALVLLLIVVITRTLLYTSKATSTEELKTSVPVSDSALQRLSKAIQFETVSLEDESLHKDSTALRQFEAYIRSSFPLSDSLLEKTVINGYSLLYTWKGSDASLQPLILTAHMDVVPPGNAKDWTQGAFSGAIKDGFIWGRGSLDDKVSVFGILESVEMLLKENFHPKRTVLLAFGHDEEIGGQEGAKQIAAYLAKNNTKAAMLVDEGMVLTKGIVPGIEKPVALIGVSEKGYLSLQLSVEFTGGHSSMPGKETAIGILSHAITRLQDHPFPAHICEPVDLFLSHVGPEMPFVSKLAFANRWLLEPLIISKYEKSNSGNATIRTTTAPTIFQSGEKDNVLPSSARAIVNFRILPGETVESVKAYVIKTTNDSRVEVTQNGHAQEPSAVSPSDNASFTALEKTIRQIFPGSLPAPSLMLGASDSRHYSAVCQNIYRFLPVQFEAEDLDRIHGNNERIRTEAYKNTIRFYRQLILNFD